jgi:hypothetical protein
MFQPPPEDPKDQISEKPLPALTPIESSAPADETHPLAPNAPQGDDLFYYVIECLHRGSGKAEVRKQLIAFGYSAAEAEDTVKACADYRRRHPEHAKVANPYASSGGNASMWIGGLICLVGIIITVGSCLAARNGGGRSIVAWGAIIFGAIQFFRGLSQRNR